MDEFAKKGMNLIKEERPDTIKTIDNINKDHEFFPEQNVSSPTVDEIYYKFSRKLRDKKRLFEIGKSFIRSVFDQVNLLLESKMKGFKI